MTDTSHIMPIDDLREHKEGKDCWCSPKIDDEYPNVFVHNSLDGREKYETGERKLN